MPSTPVAPPQETPSLYGLFTAARIQPLSGHAEAGIVYDVVCDTTMKYWPGVCRPIPPGPSIDRTITVAFVGTRTGTDPDFTYTITAQATVDSGPDRPLTITVDGGTAVALTTGGPAVQIFTGTAAAAHAVIITDLTTGSTASINLTQAAADGAVTPPSEAFVVADPTEAEKLVGETAQRVGATPFVVYGVETCLLGLSFDEQVDRARQRLALVEQTAVERAFWTGEQGNEVALATSNPEILPDDTATPVPLTVAVSLLEEWLGQQGSYIGFLHINRGASAIADEEGLVHRVGPRLETSVGNVWVFGGGYPRTGPTGTTAPGPRQMWMFATRQPTVRRTEVFVPGDAEDGSALNYRKNNVFVAAERTYVVDVPCQTAAVLVNLADCRCSGTTP